MVVAVMHPYVTLADGTEIVHSQILNQDGVNKVIVHFERPTEHGFDSARCELPSYTWAQWEGGFSNEERRQFERYLKDNAHLLYR